MPTVYTAGSGSAYALPDPTPELLHPSFTTMTLVPGQTITRRTDTSTGQPIDVVTYTGGYVTWTTPSDSYRYAVPRTAGPVEIIVPDLGPGMMPIPATPNPPESFEWHPSTYPVSPEERRAAEEQRHYRELQHREMAAQREHERQQEYERARQVAQRAETRARETLLEFLDNEQIAMLNEHSYIEVVAEDGSVYQLTHGRDGVYCVRGPMLDNLHRDQRRHNPGLSHASLSERRHFCIHPAHGFPPSDEMLCMKALIENDYESFLRIANY